MKFFIRVLLISFLVVFSTKVLRAQQDPQFTQYMYNTMTVNPAYVGSKGYTVINAFARTQWVGFEGAPNTQVLSFDTPLSDENNFGFGLNLVNDRIAASHETYLDSNISYAINIGREAYLSLGLKFGLRLLNIDWRKGVSVPNDPNFTVDNNIVNKFSPTIGAGIYYYDPSWYIGLSVPNFFQTKYYDDSKKQNYKVGVKSMHFYLIAGYVAYINNSIKFKPATLIKGVPGLPLSIDLSANFMFNDKFTVGISYRWDDSISALLALQVSNSLRMGYSYDLTTSNYNVTNSGTHEVMLNYEIFKEARMRSPRFF